jgi:ABC-2 type transport system ATP-binding protein
VIHLENLQKVSGATVLLDIDHLQLEAGDVVAIQGPQASGKRLLLSLLLGQTLPTAGSVRVLNRNPAQETAAVLHQTGVLFEENGLYTRLSTRANLALACRLQGVPLSRVDVVLKEVGLLDQANTLAGRLSPSLARRLAFGRTILSQPQLLLLVDPFRGCDASSIIILSQVLQTLADADCATLILASEGMGLRELCQVIYELHQGRIVRTHSPQDESQADTPFKIPVRLESKVVLLNPADVLYVSTQDNKIYLHTLDEAWPSQFTVTELEQRLARSGFFRAHRSYLVNLQRVQAVIPYTRNSYSLVLDDPAKTEIPLSKTAARELRELLDY